MRHLMKFASVLVLATLILTACSTQATPTPAPATQAPAAPAATQPAAAPAATQPAAAPEATQPAAAAPAGDKVLTIIDPVVDKDWSPLRGGGWNVRLLSLWWAAPIWADMAGTLHPQVFASWSSSDDFKVWTFKIDPKAVFSDGSAITAEDVKGTWELCTQPLTKHQRVSLFLSGIVGYDDAVAGKATTLPGIVAKDASTVEVTLTAPDPIFVNRIATNLIGPVKISQARGADGQEITEWWSAANKPAVSGPYMPSAMNLDTGSVEWVPNPKWFGDAPKLAKINLIAVEDGEAAMIMLKKGEADINLTADLPTAFDELGADYVGTNLPATPVLQNFWINSKVAPMDDINCRKALLMAANPTEMFAASHPHGPGQPGTTLVAQILKDKDTNTYPTNDPEGAKAAFAQCKYKDAMPKIYIAGASNAQVEAAAQTLIEQWRQVLGIEQTELVQAYDKLPKSDQDKVQIFRDDVGSRVADAATLLLSSVYSKSGNAQAKMGGYKNAEADKLIEEASALPPSDANRDAKALAAEKLVLDDFVYIPWYAEGPLMHQMSWVLNYSKNLDWQIVEPWNLDMDMALKASSITK